MHNDLFENGTPTPASAGDTENSHHPQHIQLAHGLRPPFPRNVPKGTSELVAQMIAAHTLNQLARIYRAILASGTHGFSDNEGVIKLGIFIASYPARWGELVKLGLIPETENRRLNHRGCPAAVWVALGHMEGSGDG